MSRLFDPRCASIPAQSDAHTPAGRGLESPDSARLATQPQSQSDGFAKVIKGLNEELTISEMARLYRVPRHRIFFFLTRLREVNDANELTRRGLTPEAQRRLRRAFGAI